MKKFRIFSFLLFALRLPSFAADTNDISTASNSEAMAPKLFRHIVESPADTNQLIPQLANIPFWTNAIITNVMAYESGKIITETMSETAKTVGGKYIVFSVESGYYHQTMNSILMFDVKASAPKTYGLFGDSNRNDVLTEAVINYDFKSKTYAMKATFGDGFEETTKGSYTDMEDKAKTVVKKAGEPFMTREVVAHPVTAVK